MLLRIPDDLSPKKGERMAEVVVSSPASWFDGLVQGIIQGSPKYPFRLRVMLGGYTVTPRHSMFEYFLDLGKDLIPSVLRHESLGQIEGASLLFVFPERWMSVHEQKLFIYQLKNHPQAHLLKGVDIVTQNPLIVGGLEAGSLAMFKLADNDPEAGSLSK